MLSRLLPFAEGTVLAIHILGWFAVLISIIVMGQHHTNEEVWGMWLNLSGYQPGVGFFVGLIGPVFAFMGADGATHMSEEVMNPRTTIPWALITSITLNGILGFGMIIALLYCQGNIMQNLNSVTGFPFIEAFLQALKSQPWATAYTSILLVLLIFANVAVLAATSRATYAFARDSGLPFSNWIGHLHERTKLPLWALAFSVTITMLLGLIVSTPSSIPPHLIKFYSFPPLEYRQLNSLQRHGLPRRINVLQHLLQRNLAPHLAQTHWYRARPRPLVDRQDAQSSCQHPHARLHRHRLHFLLLPAGDPDRFDQHELGSGVVLRRVCYRYCGVFRPWQQVCRAEADL